MEYNDESYPTLENYEKMAKEYNNSLKEQGFVFVKLNDENYNFLLDEVFEIFFKLRSSYRYLGTFLDSNKFFILTNEQIDEMRKLFNYTKNKAFQIRVNKTKTFLNTISLEAKLIIKLNELAIKSDKITELSKIAEDRLIMTYENYEIIGTFNNFSNLSLN